MHTGAPTAMSSFDPPRSPRGPDTPASSAHVAQTIPCFPPDPVGTFPPEGNDLLAELGLDASGYDPGPPDGARDTGFVVRLPGAAPHLPGYEILEVLGEGGMGVVYKARDTKLNRLVAVKMIRAGGRVGPNELVRFLAEAEVVAAIKHPHVVEVYSSGGHGERPYFVMEFVGGGSLARRLKDHGPLPPREAAAVVAAVARGVHAAHDAGIIHRDLKPGNVLLNAECGMRNAECEDKAAGSGRDSALRIPHSAFSPKVSDFGLAKRLGGPGGMTRTLAVLGTPAYMAPEQARGGGKFVGPEADIYALGVILYECLTGTVPFLADEPLAMLRQVTEDAPPPPRSRAAGVPRDLDLICLRCLAKEPHDRYATAAELAADLDRFLAGQPVAARPVSAATRVARWAARNPKSAALAALLLLVLVGTPTAVVWHRGELATSRANTATEQEAHEREKEAREREKEGRVAAEKLAAVRELFALRGAVRQREADRAAGWTWANRTDLARAAGLTAVEPHTRVDLRSEAVTVLLAPDLRRAAPVGRGMTASVAVTSPGGALVALGEFKAGGIPLLQLPVHVRLVDPVTGKLVHDLTFPPERVIDRTGGAVQDGVRGLAFSPDGKRLFVATRAARVHRFDLPATGKAPAPARTWKAPAQAEGLAVSADGTAVFGACGRELVVRWDAQTGAETARQPAFNGARGLTVEPGTGDVIAADGAGLVRLDPATLLPRGPSATGSGCQVPVFLPGGRGLVAGRGDSVEVFDPATLRPTAAFLDPDVLTRVAHTETVTAAAAHPSGAYLATVAEYESVVKVWAVGSGRRVGLVPLPGTDPIGLAWSGDGRFLLVTGPNETFRFEFIVSPAERFIGFHPNPLEAVAFAADGRRVAALGAAAPRDGAAVETLFLTDADGRPAVAAPFPPRRGAARPGLSADPKTGAFVATRTGTDVQHWVPGGNVGDLGLAPGLVVRCPRYSPDGSAVWAVVDSSRVEAWDATTRARRGAWRNVGGEFVRGLPGLDALAVGRTLAVAAGGEGTVRVFDNQVKRVAEFSGLDPVLSVALTADDAVAAAGTQGGKLRLIRLTDRVELPARDAHPGGVTAVAFNPDGSLLATGGKDRAVRLWRRTADGYEVVWAAAGLPAALASLEFARDGNRLLILMAGARAARVWDVDRLKEQLTELNLGW